MSFLIKGDFRPITSNELGQIRVPLVTFVKPLELSSTRVLSTTQLQWRPERALIGLEDHMTLSDAAALLKMLESVMGMMQCATRVHTREPGGTLKIMGRVQCSPLGRISLILGGSLRTELIVVLDGIQLLLSDTPH